MRSDSELTDLVSMLEQRLHDHAWRLVEVIIRAELHRRASFMSQSLDHAFETALATQQARSSAVAAPRLPRVAVPQKPRAVLDEVREPRDAGQSSATGIVKWFNEAKGFGFILAADGGDVFVHYKHVVGDGFRTLDEGQRVAYRERTGPRGRFATDVRPA